MVKTIAVAAGVVVVSTVAVLGVLRSRRTCHPIERSAVVIAPLGAVQSRIANLQQWTTWSPWERPDADFDRKFEGPASGAGASYSWSGGDDVGSGRLTVERSGGASLPARGARRNAISTATRIAAKTKVQAIMKTRQRSTK